MTFQERIILVLLGLNVLLGRDAIFAKDAGTAYLFRNTTVFQIPSGSYRLRILAIGGGGGGCGGIKQGKGEGAEPVVNIIKLHGPETFDVIVGQGGKGARGHNEEATSNGMHTRFGTYVKANGGRGCTNDPLVRSFQTLKGIDLFRLSDIANGEDGMDSTLLASTVQGGQGGYLINGTGPRGTQGESNNSASGGTGYGAGGGAGGAIYSGDSTKIFSGGNGADGVLYIELVNSVCTKPVDVMFAVESRKIPEEFDNQLYFVQDIIKEFQVSFNYTRVALINYAEEAQLRFGFNDFDGVKSLENGIFPTKNDLNASGFIRIADVYKIALITFHHERYDIAPNRRQASKAFVLLTYGENLTQVDELNKFKKDMKKQSISIAVVVMANDTNTSHVQELVENVHNLFTAHATDTSTDSFSETKSWIAEIICQDPTNVKPSPSMTVSNTGNLTSSTSSFKSFYQSTPVPHLSASSSADVSTSLSPSPSSLALLRSSVTQPAATQKTVDELERDLSDVLNLNVSTIDINDLSNIKKYINLAGSLLAESQRIPNASERGIEFQLVERIEAIGFATAEQMRPTSAGYNAITLSSGKVEMEVATLNLTQLNQITLPFIPTDSVNTMESVHLPRSVFTLNKTDTDLGQVVWLMFEALTAMNNKRDSMVTSRVMDLIVQPRYDGVFQEPITMSFSVSQRGDYKTGEDSCVFWDTNNTHTDARHGSWSNGGCHLAERKHSTVSCHCDHLTSFAILTKVKPFVVTEEHKLYLSVITSVGCSLSILGCILTIANYAFLPSLISQRTVIHLNLVTAMLLAQVCFLVIAFGVKPQESPRKEIGCFAAAVCLYYFYTCVFTWMLVEGVHIYFMVIRVFELTGRGRKRVYLVIGWGFPLIMTAVVVSVMRKELLSKHVCWLSVETGAIWTFVGPILFVMTVNFAILVMVLRVTSQTLNEDSGVRSLAKAFATLLPILGLTWIFGLLAVSKHTIVLEYLFCIFNSIQGFFIFLVYCLKNSEVRREFKRKLRNMAATRNPGTSSNPSFAPKQATTQMKCIDQPDKSLDTRL